MRAFVTGATGFVGHHLVEHLHEMDDVVTPASPDLDVLDGASLQEALSASEPDVVYHLAGLANVAESWQFPQRTFEVNAIGTLRVLEAARALKRTPRVLVISSAEVYGGGDGRPLDESAPLLPATPYASSKVAAEFIALQEFLGRGLDVVRVRPFNHVGPGQSDSFVVSALARRVVEAERSGLATIRVGNLNAVRDFTDVRDVVRAYRLLVERGRAGEVYNVCSEQPVSIAELLSELVRLANVPIESVVDEALFRPSDVPLLVGDCSALRGLTGWQPAISRADTFSDVLADWRARLVGAPQG